MSDFHDMSGAGGGFMLMYVWRFGRWLVYSAVGIVRPGWRHAKKVVRATDEYTRLAIANQLVYLHPEYQGNLVALERELKRVRRGGQRRVFDLPFDFPPGAAERVRTRLRDT